ncbi:MAG: hypothetical protein ACOX4I_03250 [Anaerovoracaceae bacterium]|jgi:hypothetical protein
MTLTQCPKCKYIVYEGMHECPNCGQKLTTGAGPGIVIRNASTGSTQGTSKDTIIVSKGDIKQAAARTDAPATSRRTMGFGTPAAHELHEEEYVPGKTSIKASRAARHAKENSLDELLHAQMSQPGKTTAPASEEKEEKPAGNPALHAAKKTAGGIFKISGLFGNIKSVVSMAIAIAALVTGVSVGGHQIAASTASQSSKDPGTSTKTEQKKDAADTNKATTDDSQNSNASNSTQSNSSGQSSQGTTQSNSSGSSSSSGSSASSGSSSGSSTTTQKDSGSGTTTESPSENTTTNGGSETTDSGTSE